MDKILTSEGGYPLRLDDLDDLQQTLRGVLQGIATALGDGIISGCRVGAVSGGWKGQPGYISYKGNIYTAEGNVADLTPLGGRYPRNKEFYWVLTEHRERSVVYEDGHEELSRHHYRATLVVSETAPSLPHFKAWKGVAGKTLAEYISEMKTIVDAKAKASEAPRTRTESPEEDDRYDKLRDHEPPGHS